MTITYNKQVLIKRGNTAGISSYVGPVGELVLNTDTMAVYVQNGVTPGGVLVTGGGSNYSNVNVNSYLQQFDGNIIPTGNAVHSLGTIDHQWKDLWVSNATIYLNSVPLGLDPTGNLTFAGNPLVSVVNGNLSVGGTNINVNPFDQSLNTTDNVTFNQVTIGSNSGESHLVVDAANYWSSIQWKNMSFAQDPGARPFECQAQLLRVFKGNNAVQGHEERVAVSVVQPTGTEYNGLMITTSEGKIPDAPYNDGNGTMYNWVFGGDGSTNLPIGAPINFGYGNARIQAGMGFHIGSEEPINLYTGLPSISITATSSTEDGGPTLSIIIADFPNISLVNPVYGAWTANINNTVYNILSTVQSQGNGAYWLITLDTQTSFAYGAVATFTRADAIKVLTLETNGTLTLPNGQLDFNAPYSRFKDANNTGVQLGSPDDQNYVNVDNTAVTIQVNSDGVTGPHEKPQRNWLFDTDGILTLPSNSYLESTDANLKLGAQGTVTIRSDAANSGTTKSWRFGTDGSITFPDNSVQTTAYTGVSSTLVWAARAFSNTNASYTQAVAYDSQGNSFSLIRQAPWNGPGNSKSTIVKLSSDGTEIWSVDIPDSNSVNPWSLTCDGDNNLYAIVQRLNGSVYNNVVMKLNGANGSILWQVDIQDSQAANNMQAIAFNISGGGGFNGVAIAGTAYNGNDNDFFISGIQSDGTPGGVHTWGDQWDQEAYGLAINNATGDMVLAGRKQSNTDNAYYLEMVKFNFGGGVVWQKSITVEGNYNVQGTDVCLLADGNWAVVASHNMANGNYGVVTMKINNTDGTVMWSREIANGCTNISSSIATDDAGNIYISASTFNGTGTNNVPLVTKIIGAYDTNGNIVWQKYFRSPGDNWVVDQNWWNNIGSTGKTLAVHGNKLLVAASLAPLSPNSGPVNSYGVVAQLSLLGEDETIGIFETRNSYLTDSAVVLTLADTVYDYTTATQTLSAGSTLSTSVGTLTFVIDHAGAQVSQLVNNGKSVSLQPNGLLVNEIGRSVTGEFDGVTDSGNNFSNTPIGIRNASGYKRLVGLTNSAQTWFDINTVATQLGVNPAWIMGLTVEYQVQSTNFSGGSNASMTGQIIIASSNNSGRDISVTHSESVLSTNNSSNDVVFANLNFWQPSGWTLQAIRTDSNSQQLDIVWTAKVFINASENYC